MGTPEPQVVVTAMDKLRADHQQLTQAAQTLGPENLPQAMGVINQLVGSIIQVLTNAESLARDHGTAINQVAGSTNQSIGELKRRTQDIN